MDRVCPIGAGPPTEVAHPRPLDQQSAVFEDLSEVLGQLIVLKSPLDGPLPQQRAVQQQRLIILEIDLVYRSKGV